MKDVNFNGGLNAFMTENTSKSKCSIKPTFFVVEVFFNSKAFLNSSLKRIAFIREYYTVVLQILDDEGMEAVLINEYGRKHAQGKQTTYLDMTQMICGTVIKACKNTKHLDSVGDVSWYTIFFLCSLWCYIEKVLIGIIYVHVYCTEIQFLVITVIKVLELIYKR